MTQEQISKFNMIERAVKFVKDNTATMATNPAFQADFNLLESQYNEMLRLTKLIESDGGHTQNKQTTKAGMIARGLDVCKHLNCLGILNKDSVLMKMSDHSKSSLSNGKEEEVLLRCQNIAEKARELLSELTTKRGIKEALLTQFEDDILQFRAIKPGPISAQQEKSVLKSELNTIFDMADMALTLLAGSALNFKEEDDAFLARFEKATAIIAYQTSTTKTKFVFINGETKERMTAVGVESTALNLNKILMTEKDMTVQTTYHEGSDFIFTKEGFEKASMQNMKIIKGKTNVIEVVMMPLKAA